MERVLIDGTDLSVSRLSFGTASLHRIVKASRRAALLDAAFDHGFSHFDTSPYYGHGIAEVEIGRFLAGRRDRVTVATKVGLYPPGRGRGNPLSVWGRKLAGRFVGSLNEPTSDGALERAQASLEASLRRCRTDYFDLVLLHEPVAARFDPDAFVAWFERNRSAGRLRHWGVAGETDSIRAWTAHGHEVAQVVQTRDAVDGNGAGFLLKAGRALQFTYGYMSRTEQAARGVDVYRQALARNDTGSVLLSTRSADRLRVAAQAAS